MIVWPEMDTLPRGPPPPTPSFLIGGPRRAILLDFFWLRGWGVEWAGEGWASLQDS